MKLDQDLLECIKTAQGGVFLYIAENGSPGMFILGKISAFAMLSLSALFQRDALNFFDGFVKRSEVHHDNAKTST